MRVHIEADDVIIAVGYGLIAGAASAVGWWLSAVLIGIAFIALGVLLGTRRAAQ